MAWPSEPDDNSATADDTRAGLRRLFESNAIANQHGSETQLRARLGNIADTLAREARHGDANFAADLNRWSVWRCGCGIGGCNFGDIQRRFGGVRFLTAFPAFVRRTIGVERLVIGATLGALH